jgi:CO/xanthine dehydrogenase Mo-binding subunit
VIRYSVAASLWIDGDQITNANLADCLIPALADVPRRMGTILVRIGGLA